MTDSFLLSIDSKLFRRSMNEYFWKKTKEGEWSKTDRRHQCDHVRDARRVRRRQAGSDQRRRRGALDRRRRRHYRHGRHGARADQRREPGGAFGTAADPAGRRRRRRRPRRRLRRHRLRSLQCRHRCFLWPSLCLKSIMFQVKFILILSCYQIIYSTYCFYTATPIVATTYCFYTGPF